MKKRIMSLVMAVVMLLSVLQPALPIANLSVKSNAEVWTDTISPHVVVTLNTTSNQVEFRAAAGGIPEYTAFGFLGDAIVEHSAGISGVALNSPMLSLAMNEVFSGIAYNPNSGALAGGFVFGKSFPANGLLFTLRYTGSGTIRISGTTYDKCDKTGNETTHDFDLSIVAMICTEDGCCEKCVSKYVEVAFTNNGRKLAFRATDYADTPGTTLLLQVSITYYDDIMFSNRSTLTAIGQSREDKFVVSNHSGRYLTFNAEYTILPTVASFPRLFTYDVFGAGEIKIDMGVTVNPDGNRKDERVKFKLSNVRDTDELLATPSNVYNHDLAILCARLSKAAYNRNDILRELVALGFKETKDFGYNHSYKEERKTDKAAHTFALKTVDGKTTVAIVVRGTRGVREWVANICLQSFNRVTDRVFVNLKAFLEENNVSIADKNVRYIITGHSRGGAVANLLSVKLMNDNKVSRANIYNYNFAPPNVAVGGKNNPRWRYDNIFNICNAADVVPFVPAGSIYGRYGMTTWFNVKGGLGAAHDKQLYLDYVTSNEFKQRDFSPNKQNYYRGSLAGHTLLAVATVINCPVDVQVFNSDGELMLEIVNDELVYYYGDDCVYECGYDCDCEYEYDEDDERDVLLVFIDGHKKNIISLLGHEYTFVLTGTDEGVMNLYVSDIDISSGDTFGQMQFTGVPLFDGKTMKSVIGGSETEIQDTQLFVTDGEDVTEEIKGVFVPAPLICKVCLVCKSDMLPQSGYILGNDTVTTADALEILKYIVKLPGAISQCNNARKAALIVGDTVTTADALEILKHIVKLPNKIDGTSITD